ncbi:MAG: hypothetical protein K2O01_09135, partial [Bacteroidales bacterium]|nr:hypothetical protein [Bacteroidales bacterium]
SNQPGRTPAEKMRQEPQKDVYNWEHRSRILGILLIGFGSLSLVLTLMFSGIPALSSVPERLSRMWTNMTSRFKVWIYGPEKEPSPWDFSDVKPLEELKAVPSAQGWSALDSFYATHPAVEGEEEYYLDPALWREPARRGGSADAVASGFAVASGLPSAGGTDSVNAPLSPRRMGLWTGPADGTLVDTSIRPAQEQLRRQGAMPLQTVAADSGSAGGAVSGPSLWSGGISDGLETADAKAGPTETAAVNADGVTGGDRPAGVPVPPSNAIEAAVQAPVDAPTSQKPLHVEFWESPIHYKGYQLNGNNLILYGINEADSLRFENHPDGIWMYHKEAVYRLTSSSEMQRFELISGTSSLEEPVGPAVDESGTASDSVAGAE